MSVKTRVTHELLGPWICHDPYFERIVDLALNAEPPDVRCEDHAEDSDVAPQREFEAHNGIAVITTLGPTVKYESFLTDFFGFVSTNRQQELFRQARNDDSILAVIHVVDSPGGTANGAEQFGDAIEETDRIKPVFTYVTDSAMSGGLWYASQSRFLAANAGAQIGSIGARAELVDATGALEMAGIKVISIATGKYKDLGAEGKKVTQDDIAEVMRQIQSVTDLFILAVARGRGMSVTQVRELADGRVWIAAEAKEKGLIDKVMSYREFLAHVASEVGIIVDPDRFEIRSARKCAWKPEEAGEREKFELRNASTAEVSTERDVISGYAVKWGELSVRLRWPSDGQIYRERFMPGAFTEALADPELNAKARVDHVGGTQTIGRTSNGTLLLREDDVGLYYEIKLPNTQAARDLAVLVDDAYVDGASFAFFAAPGGDRWLTERTGLVREISQASVLDDVSVTDDPAFLGSTAEVERRSKAAAGGETEKKVVVKEKVETKSTCLETTTMTIELVEMRKEFASR